MKKLVCILLATIMLSFGLPMLDDLVGPGKTIAYAKGGGGGGDSHGGGHDCGGKRGRGHTDHGKGKGRGHHRGGDDGGDDGGSDNGGGNGGNASGGGVTAGGDSASGVGTLGNGYDIGWTNDCTLEKIRSGECTWF